MTFTAAGHARRSFLSKTSALGAVSLFGVALPVAAEPPPETRKIRVLHSPGICLVPQFLAQEFLRLEGFSEVEYVSDDNNTSFEGVAAGKADIVLNDVPGA